MLTYTPGSTIVHRLDPRTKLAFQFAFALVAFGTLTLPRLVGLFVIGLGCLHLADLSIRAVLRAYWFVLVVLALGPLIAAITLGPPWLRLDPAVVSLRSVARIVPILFVSAAYIHATPIRETRAAIQRTLPGRVGQLLGVGVALTFRYVPVIRADLRRVRDAIRARNGDTRSLRERSQRLTVLMVVRALRRSDQLAVALQARCFAWNPTLPRLRFSRIDLPVWGLSIGFVAFAAIDLLGF
ncbi:energy-coupling factor transporter transmembrane protein EcfT [Halonotius terrestris]|uniref:Energy-coupling factor transporter transmembrane protein EcfT n=1 Tax=Halonotius terrestris TaxID=2487750 RepID=A0A8J8TC63_9EURY|nr:energy-coupling factor transporter transmembrane component T [Halonotius terrestris]TQQ82862.1 energy-coupling factor transporter transmembrane protein EcfT [Halonotius terrestris]